MATPEPFIYVPLLPLRACPDWAGLFVSRGVGRHPTRRLSSYEIIFVRAGILEIQEEDTEFTVHAGETLLLWPGRRHRGTANYAPDLEFLWIHFSLNTVEVKTVPEKADSKNSGLMLRVPQHTAVSNPDFLESLMRHYLNEEGAHRLDPASSGLLVSLMLCEMARPPQVSDTVIAANVLAGRAEIHINTHFHEPLTTSQVANELLCNPSYLSRVYRQYYGQTITEAIGHRRMQYAQNLLLNTDQKVNEIAQACGITDTSYFLKLFKRQTGMTALAFRRLYALRNTNMPETTEQEALQVKPRRTS